MMVGLQGAGSKSFGVIGQQIGQGRKRPLMIAADLIVQKQPLTSWRLLQRSMSLSSHSGTEVPAETGLRQGLEQARANHNDYVLITAGRSNRWKLHGWSCVMSKPLLSQKPLAVDAMIGQEAATWRELNEQLEVTGVILTKIDGDTRGGAALSVRQITGKPIKFTGTGENHWYRTFHPDRSSADPRYGDMLTLIEKASQEYDEKRLPWTRWENAENTSISTISLITQTKYKNTDHGKICSRCFQGWPITLPWRTSKVDEREIARKRAIVSTMTPAERKNPDLESKPSSFD